MMDSVPFFCSAPVLVSEILLFRLICADTHNSKKRSRQSPEANDHESPPQGEKPARKNSSGTEKQAPSKAGKFSDETVDKWIDELLL